MQVGGREILVRYTEACCRVLHKLSSPNVSIGDMVLIKPDSRLRHAGMTNK